MNKKITSVVFSALMVMSMVAIGFTGGAVAQQDASISLEDIEGNAGDQVTVTMSANADNVAGYQANVTFDPDVVEYVEASGADFSDPTVNDQNADQGSVFLTQSAASGQDNPDLVTLTFDIVGEPGESSDLGFVESDTQINDASGNNIAASYNTGSITVADDGSDGGDTDGGDGTVENRDVADNGDVYITSGNTIYQGEDDLAFYNTETGETIAASRLEGTSGNREGSPLQMPIPTDTQTGAYDLNGPEGGPGGFTTTVVTPRITTSEVQLNDDDVSQVGSENADNLQIAAEWNFYDAEDLDLTVEDPSGTDITNEVVNDGTLSSENGEETSTPLDLSGEDAGEYTVIFEGADNLDHSDVVQEYTIELTTDDSVAISTSEDTVTQGTNVQYTVSGGTNGDYHMVTVDSDDFRSDNINNVFRNVGDTTEVGFAADGSTVSDPADAEYAYAVVEIDGTEGVGSVRSSSLDDTTVTLDVYTAAGGGSYYDIDADGVESLDDVDISVEEGEITIDSPDGDYTIGSEVDINGTATSADAVDIYVRDNNDWELLYAGISVDSNDEYEEEDVTLSGTGERGASLLRQADTYRYGVVDASESNGTDVLSTTRFSRASSTSQSLRTVEGDLNASLETTDGQINYDVDNRADISGTAEGQSSVAMVLVDRRGNVAVSEIDVDNDGTIDEEDYTIPERADGGQLSEGSVTAHFISQSRDDRVGDGDIPGQSSSDIDGLVSWVSNDVADSNLNAQQVRERIVSETTEDTASDDLMVTQTFRYAESQTSVDSVYPEEAQASGVNPVATGETMVVEGTTNLRPDDNSITVEILNEDAESLEIESTDEWEGDGQYSVSFDTSNLEPGTYTVLSDDSDNTDRVEVEIVEEREQPDDGDDGTDDGDDGTDDGDDGTDDGDDGTDDGDDGTDDGDDGTDGDDGSDGDDGESEDGTPGFGALVALVALIAAALLATRRND